MVIFRYFFASAFLLLLSHPALSHDHSQAAYLGNEGVLVTHGDTKILFDAFYAESYDYYQLVPNEISEAMLSGAPPFDGVDAIFVSHVHGDHFTAAPAIEYLRAHPNARLYGPPQVREALENEGIGENDPLMTRLVSINLHPDDPAASIEIGSLKIAAVATRHIGNHPTVQNYVWRVTLDDTVTVIHLGDSDAKMNNFKRHATTFKERRLHASFPPYWFYESHDGRKILRELVAADQTIAIHVPQHAAGKGGEWRERLGGDLFTDPGEFRILSDK